MGKKDQRREKTSHNLPGSDNNGQSLTKQEGGEYRNGRKAQFKNHNPHDESASPNEYLTPEHPTEYLNSKEDE
ncbi:hypothetical protein PU629_01225 [Pullulanibacillus sp. KACC 23026]|uniref:hypothetical protein n=1 Tax=Pullulanibacillus sp. KACC 23026 TaxID=3028315 RepID=UPI0023AF9041|nr:hypothetical protein [Pullulanibacillus sp. KACC 23026]WEG13008.1 hypothetical protein PU629_01225 [Pullulanibacillus sp. KACC 23026]